MTWTFDVIFINGFAIGVLHDNYLDETKLDHMFKTEVFYRVDQIRRSQCCNIKPYQRALMTCK